MSDGSSSPPSSVGSIVEEASEPDVTNFECLFCTQQFDLVPTLVYHCSKEHDFDIYKVIKEVTAGGDDLAIFKLINFLRLETRKGTDPTSITVNKETLADDKLLQPTDPGDALLYSLGDVLPDLEKPAASYEAFEARKGDMPQHEVEHLKIGDGDSGYFDSYKRSGIHREMIQDAVRTNAYRDFIEHHASLFKGKTILDVGCGTGILSLFCARAGAAKVFAVDFSDIAAKARDIVAANEYQDTITVIQGKVEGFNVRSIIGDNKPVDIIISEWMGYALLYEGMLDSVLTARDLFLKDGGLIFPSHCTLHVAPISDPEFIASSNGATFWKDVYGFDMSVMIPIEMLNERDIGVFDVPAKAICGSALPFYTLDIMNITVKELEFTAPFSIKLDRDIQSLDAFAIWFDTFFVPPGSSGKPDCVNASAWGETGQDGVAFTTGPFGAPTHWHQAVLLVGQQDRGKGIGTGTEITGSVLLRKRKKDARAIVVEISWKGDGSEGPISGTLSRSMS
ncbi:histone-arginine methyltransferase CARM1 [Lindgomyces ingoldianus]|uniref:Histone-arginine methyltransferase CARM1 n=1 Tax=Lindgomyces ingoldianus TaxID=673940 RepID=A0ACB6QNW0_9PLEO|nr:histone-arginine methyltransferase CARM1 [Lindgomyces ingoldianus]KAF2468648.1 histone-arginine methyltransferase CARM1 [Lindgomyces ingoldianus]